jgi:chromosome segregation ATPase
MSDCYTFGDDKLPVTDGAAMTDARRIKYLENESEVNYEGWRQADTELKGAEDRINELAAELESVKKENALLIEMNFNLEQQYSAIKEDLDQANDDCSDWEDAYHRMEDKVEELLAALNSIEEIAQNR